MRLKILVALMGILAVVLTVLEVNYHYIYWALAPKPKTIPRFLESRASDVPVETAAAVLVEKSADPSAAVIPSKLSAEVQPDAPGAKSFDNVAELDRPAP